MKKKYFGLMVLLAGVILVFNFVGCATKAPNIYHEVDSTTENISRLYVNSGLTIKKINGINVDWGAGQIVNIKPTRHEIVANYYIVQPILSGFVNGVAMFTYIPIVANDLKITGDFIAGKNYVVFYNNSITALQIMEITDSNEYKHLLKSF